MSRDSIGDFLTIMRNGVMITKPSVVAPYSKMRFAIAKILKEQGFVRDVIVEEADVFIWVLIILNLLSVVLGFLSLLQIAE